MDHTRILNQIRDKKNLEKAFHYAYYDRTRSDSFYDPFEMDHVAGNKERILDEVFEELKDINGYTQRAAYSYFPAKTDLCFRRMIYIPFKDLVIRYAFVIVLADRLDSELSVNCFANRRAKGRQAEISLLKDFSQESWSNFCEWQRDSIDSNCVLLRTDISSFYDSVSHDYLIRIIADEFSLDTDTQVMRLFKKLLQVPVISYSPLSGKAQKPELMKQGLPIGNSTEGFLSNIYLKNVDEAMEEIDAVKFGRYNDDMRIFAKERKDALDAMLVLQELLLAKGLNLNTAKTEIAENKEEIERLRTKFYDVSVGYIEEECETKIVKNNIKDKVDRNFDEFDRPFEEGAEIESNKDAKDYCKFLSTSNNKGKQSVKLFERTSDHIEKLGEIMVKWAGSSKHAAWLIVQSAFYEGVPENTANRARKIMFQLLQNDAVSSYGKYRLIHHLIKLRNTKRGDEFRFLDKLSEKERNALVEIIPNFLKCPAFELNLIGLYAFRLLGHPLSELERYVQKYMPKGNKPIRNALSYISEPVNVSKSLAKPTYREPDDIPAPY